MNMVQELRGKPVVDAMMARIASDCQRLQEHSIAPTLAIVRIGERSDDCSYERMAIKRADVAGIKTQVHVLGTHTTQQEVIDLLHAINADDTVHGCLLFRPLPAHMSETDVCEALCEAKDVDGITTASMARVYADQEGFAPCTAQAVIELLDHYGIDIAGKRVCVAGRSLVIGRPVSLMLMNRHATVTMCHSRTQDIERRMREADIVVCATGRARGFGPECFAPGQTVIDVGINFDQEGILCGDVDFGPVSEIVESITPVPGGIGGITTAVLMEHVVRAAARQHKLS